MKNIIYDRAKALAYAEKWALSCNPAYYSFSGLGGDCTNFISQCIYAGCGVMNYTPTSGWYYISLNKRSPAWTRCGFLQSFLISNKSAGPFGSAADIKSVIPATSYSSETQAAASITVCSLSPSPALKYTSQLTATTLHAPLSSYIYENIRYIHIQGARKY
jgi:hypothetical protein